MARSYHEQSDINNTIKLRELLKELPTFVKIFFRGVEPTTAARTRIAYAYDLRVYFDYLLENHADFMNTTMQAITVEMLDLVKPMDLEAYMEYLKYYQSDTSNGSERINQELGIKRKIACLKTFYHYFFIKEMIKTNPAAMVSLPKLHDKAIVRLDVDEVANLLDQVESGEQLTERQKKFHERTRTRDLAMMTLMLGTGIRVSECVGLDIMDVDFRNGGIHIHRKGGKEVTVYFGDEVEEALLNYMDERETMETVEGHEDALFLSLQHRRITVRSVEKLVNKYAMLVTSVKHITPHKLRSTYGTTLYRETGDIYLVADVLGHSDVNTTRKHYAAIEDDRRRSARNKVQLRDTSTNSSSTDN